jgi:hypothetical protein
MRFDPSSLYASTARFDHARPLTHDDLRRAAPSVFATTAHESRSARFRPIPTIEVIDGLAEHGFSVVAAKQCVAREHGRQDYTKHLLRFRRLDDGARYTVGDTVAEILLRNGNDGSSAYDLMAGLFRIRCLNSLVAKTADIDSVKIRHSGDAINKVIEGTFTVLESIDTALAAPQDWSQIRTNRDEQIAFARAAHVLRFADNEGNVATPIRAEQLLNVRRAADDTANVWNTLNVVQENVIRGGLTGRGFNANNQLRRTTTREVRGIDQDVRLNKALFVLAGEFANMLRSAA